jgi:hypothetical protein
MLGVRTRQRREQETYTSINFDLFEDSAAMTCGWKQVLNALRPTRFRHTRQNPVTRNDRDDDNGDNHQF